MGAELFTGRLSVSVGHPFADELQTAAGTETEAGWAVARTCGRTWTTLSPCVLSQFMLSRLRWRREMDHTSDRGVK